LHERGSLCRDLRVRQGEPRLTLEREWKLWTRHVEFYSFSGLDREIKKWARRCRQTKVIENEDDDEEDDEGKRGGRFLSLSFS
jgi:hypothetical protein